MAVEGDRRAWFRRLLKVAPPAVAARSSAQVGVVTAGTGADRASLLRAFAEQDAAVPEATRTRLYQPETPNGTTIVLWHGFTNAPSQFSETAPALAALGYHVLVPRMPHHGQADLLTRDLMNLTTAELTEQVDACIDLASDLGERVWVSGISAGATLAAWAAATRDEVSRVSLLAPLAAPKGFPLPLVRSLVKWPALVPKLYLWWDPRVKADLVAQQSPYSYPGFTFPGLFAFLRLSEALLDHSVAPGHELERLVLVSNPGDFAVRRDAARELAIDVLGRHARSVGEAHVDGTLKWMHDFVDPWGTATGTTEQVTAILLATFGVGEPTAGGVLVPPLVTELPA